MSLKIRIFNMAKHHTKVIFMIFLNTSILCGQVMKFQFTHGHFIYQMRRLFTQDNLIIFYKCLET